VMIDDYTRKKVYKLQERVQKLESENEMLKRKIVDIMHIFSDVLFHENVSNETVARLSNLKFFE
ncbi:hypothetical protein, partial [Enterococcus faecium]|uniref:hypothetical protein n=1 Tax=Enterococcus faecium TaxID=1352 RepID=UPI003DA17698